MLTKNSSIEENTNKKVSKEQLISDKEQHKVFEPDYHKDFETYLTNAKQTKSYSDLKKAENLKS